MTEARRYQTTGALMMLGAATVTLLAALAAYPYASLLSMPAQITSHLLIPLGAGVFKLGYVVRLAAQSAQASATAARD